MNGRANGAEILCYGLERADRAPVGGMLRGNTPGFIFNVLIQMVRNYLSAYRWISVPASYAVFNLTGKVVLIKEHCS